MAFSFSPGGDKSKNASHYINTPDGIVLEWSPAIRIGWDDFKARRKLSPGFGIASTYSDFEYATIREKGVEAIRIQVRFYCDKSWKNAWYTFEDVLAHEQLHFDINELFARKFHQEIVLLKQNKKLTKSKVRDEYKRLQEECNSYQDRYDDDTGHSTNGYQQRLWNKKIGEELRNLEAFADYDAIIL